jgi:long-subunit acyl-CoA synthetase (AMP-forming)
MTYLSHTNAPDALVYSKLETSFGMTVVLCITGGVGLKNKRRRTHDY